MKYPQDASRSAFAWAALALLAGVVFSAAGCGKEARLLAPNSTPSSSKSFALAESSSDSVHTPPGKPPRPPVLTAQFVEADSVHAGQTGLSQWLVGNNGP